MPESSTRDSLCQCITATFWPTNTDVDLPPTHTHKHTQMALGDSHRLFLQGMMSRGAVSEAEARDLYLKATQSCDGELLCLLTNE